MKKEMLINVLQPEECRIAIVEDGILEELYVERTSHESYTGNIYKGKIVNLEPAIQAAFVDFSVGRNGFLHVSDVEPQYYQRHLDNEPAPRDREPRRDDRRPQPPPRGDRESGGPPQRGDREPGGPPPRGEREFGGPPPRGERESSGPPPRGNREPGGPPPRGEREFGGPPPPRGDREFGGPPPRGDREFGGPPPRGDREFGGPPPPRGDRERERPDRSEKGRIDRSEPRRFGEGLIGEEARSPDDAPAPTPSPTRPIEPPRVEPRRTRPEPGGPTWRDEPFGRLPEREDRPAAEPDDPRGRPSFRSPEPLDTDLPDLPPSRTQRSRPAPRQAESASAGPELERSRPGATRFEPPAAPEPPSSREPDPRRGRSISGPPPARGRPPRPLNEPGSLFNDEPEASAAEPVGPEIETDRHPGSAPSRQPGGRAAIRSRGGDRPAEIERPRPRPVEPAPGHELERPRPADRERARGLDPEPTREREPLRSKPHDRAGEPGYVPRRERSRGSEPERPADPVDWVDVGPEIEGDLDSDMDVEGDDDGSEISGKNDGPRRRRRRRGRRRDRDRPGFEGEAGSSDAEGDDDFIDDDFPEPGPTRELAPPPRREPDIAPRRQPEAGPRRPFEPVQRRQPEAGLRHQPEAGSRHQPEAGPRHQPEAASRHQPEAGPRRQPEAGPRRPPEDGPRRPPEPVKRLAKPPIDEDELDREFDFGDDSDDDRDRIRDHFDEELHGIEGDEPHGPAEVDDGIDPGLEEEIRREVEEIAELEREMGLRGTTEARPRRGDERLPDQGPGGRGGRGRAGMAKPPLQDIFRRGDEVLVQVIKESIGTKGPTLSTYISIPGRYLVLMPGLNRVGVSRKIADEGQRRKLRDIMNDLNPPKGLGFIVRTAGLERTKRELARDLAYLLRLWKVILRRIKNAKGPTPIYQESDMITRTIRDIFTSEIDTIWIDEPQAFERAQEFLRVVMPKFVDRLKLYDERVPLFHKYGIEDEIAKIQRRRVDLPDGGSIVIDQTEALVAIDVNSGNFRVENDAERTAYEMNLRAAKEIARQLRLRDLGGVIVNDFIDMREERHRRGVEKAMRDAIKRDRARTKVLRMSAFGLIEMTRQRIRPSLKRSVYEDCHNCTGGGVVKTVESMSIDVMRLIALASHREDIRRVNIGVCTPVATYLNNRKRPELARLEAEYKMTVHIRPEENVPAEHLQIECFDGSNGEIRLFPSPPPSRRPHAH